MDSDYKDALQSTRDLAQAAKRGALTSPEFREKEVARVLGLLEQSRSVLVTGLAGVGKTAVIHGVAAAIAAAGGTIRQLSAADLVTGTRYIGEWQTKVRELVRAAKQQKAVLYITDVWNLATIGRASNDKTGALDLMRPYIEQQELRLLGEATPEVLRAMLRTPGLGNLFELCEVEPLAADQIDTVVERAGTRLGLALDETTRRVLVHLTERFLPARPHPGPALHLLEQIRDYQEQKQGIGETEPLSADFVEKVFSIYTGLPRFVISRSATQSAAELRMWLQERIVGQRTAIDAVVETIALFKAGLHDPKRPLGAFLFVGPTGVGKTELARCVAKLLFGSEQRMLRLDLSEYKDPASIEVLLGSPTESDRPAKLLDPVRLQPFQVILLDEIEKAHPNVWDLLLPLLDEGHLGPPGGSPVSFRNTIVIATTNAGAQEAASARSVGFGSSDEPGLHEERARRLLEREFRPEFLNRFQHIAFFHPLSRVELRQVARTELKGILQREGITARKLLVDVADEAVDLVIDQGLDARYGARALKRELQRRLVLPIALLLMERAPAPGSVLRVDVHDGHIRVRVLDTPESKVERRDSQRLKLAEGPSRTREQVREEAATIDRLTHELLNGETRTALDLERTRFEALRNQPDLWRDPLHAGRVLRDLDRANAGLSILEHLDRDRRELVEEMMRCNTRHDWEVLGNKLHALRRRVDRARLELVLIGARGVWDALVEVRPSGGRAARDLIVRTYEAWAAGRAFQLKWLCEPLADDEPAAFAVIGDYAFGLLEREAGLHRLRDGQQSSVANVRVAAWTDNDDAPVLSTQLALKQVGQYGGKVRSRLVCGGGLVLQNGNTLADNRDLATTLATAWRAAAPSSGEIVRRYDTNPFTIRDAATGFHSGRSDALSPEAFHSLLCLRVERVELSDGGPSSAA